RSSARLGNLLEPPQGSAHAKGRATSPCVLSPSIGLAERSAGGGLGRTHSLRHNLAILALIWRAMISETTAAAASSRFAGSLSDASSGVSAPVVTAVAAI